MYLSSSYKHLQDPKAGTPAQYACAVCRPTMLYTGILAEHTGPEQPDSRLITHGRLCPVRARNRSSSAPRGCSSAPCRASRSPATCA